MKQQRNTGRTQPKQLQTGSRFTAVGPNGRSQYDDRLAEIERAQAAERAAAGQGLMARIREEQAALDAQRRAEPEPARKVGEPCVILAVMDDDPYIFSFQRYGKIARELPDGRYMITLDSAMGEWGPIPGGRLGRVHR